MSSKGSLQSILFDFWSEGETPAMKSSSNLLSSGECYPNLLEPFIFLYPKKVGDNVSKSGGKSEIQNSSVPS